MNVSFEIGNCIHWQKRAYLGAPTLWGYGQTVDKDGIKRGQSVTKEWIYPHSRHSLSSSRLSFHFDLTLSTVYPVVYPMIIPSQSLSEFYPQIIL